MLTKEERQKQTDKIVNDINQELKDKFGDPYNITLDDAIAISKYCKEKYQSYDQRKYNVQYSYWFHLARKYQKGVDASINAIKNLYNKN